MNKILITTMVCLTIWFSAQAQNVYISGPQTVSGGSIETYSVSYDMQSYNVDYSVWGGTIINSDYSSITVQWDNYNGAGYIEAFDLWYYQTGYIQVNIGTVTPEPIAYPAFQNVAYNQTPGTLYFDWITAPVNYSNIWYQWYDGNGSPISGAFNFYYTPPAQTAYLSNYYCVASVDGTIYTSNVCSVQISAFSAGSISLQQQPNFGTTATIMSVNAAGGLCSTYSYSWEQSVGGDYWTEFGTSASYPAGNTITDKTLIRRKVVCNGVTLYSNVIEIDPLYTPVDFENRDYIRETNVLVKGVKSWYVADQLPVGKKMTTVTYIDGLGRSSQIVAKEVSLTSSGTWADFVSFNEYDALGRIPKAYLPYPSSATPGKFKENTITELTSFVQTKFSETNPYAQVNNEQSPLQRVTSTYAPGSSWAGSNVGQTYQYEFNAANENVRIWTIGYAENSIPVSSSIYQDQKLFKTIHTDENGKAVIEYSDFAGNVILRKVQDKEQGQGLTAQHDGWACTYYVYDDFNRLRFIIAPKAVDWLDDNNWTFSSNTSIVDELCFWYEYDERGRTIRKKSPGAATVEVVYDDRDRAVFTQDGKQRKAGINKWEVSLYDNLDRPVITGVVSYSGGRAALQAHVSATPTGSNNLPFTVTTDGSQNHSIEINNANILPSGHNLEVMTISYYDHYNYPRVKSFTTSFVVDNTVPNDEIQPVDKTVRIKGMITGTFVKVLDGTNKFLATTYYYDNDGRTIQTHSENLFNQTDIATVQYDFAGRVRSSYSTHVANNLGTINIFNQNVLDKIGRVVKVKETINGGYTKELVEYTYDELGAVKKKRLAPGVAGLGLPELEIQEFEYNIRGWLTGINKNYANQSNQTDRYFGMEIGYDKAGANFTKTEKNGNIAGIFWKSRGDNIQRKYEYTYDNKNQLINADFKQRNTSGASWTNDKANFSSSFTYDNNGNIKTWLQYGVVPGQGVQQTDNLSYYYKNNEWSNQLLRVDEAVSTTWNGKLGDFKNGGNGNGSTDYEYNEDGQLIKDLNKEIDNGTIGGIEYNILGMPAKVTFNNTGKTITYIYDASGAKLKKIMNYPGASEYVETNYVDDFVYSNGNLEFFGHAEGRVRVVMPVYSGGGAVNYLSNGAVLPAGRIGVYDYYVKDHLNSIRMILTEEIHQTNAIATMEDGAATSEEAIFGQPGANNELLKSRAPKPTGVNGWGQNESSKVSRLSTIGTDVQVGPNVLMKVMSGDKISAFTKYFFVNEGAGEPTNIVNTVANILINAIGANPAPNSLIKGSTSVLQNQYINPGVFKSFVESSPTYSDKPKAYLNMLFFDEHFNFVPANSMRLQVENGGDGNYDLPIINQPAPQNGYVFVYLSNESNKYVYFDNFQVTHHRGRIIEENHYYAYGSNIAAISASAMPSMMGGAKQNSRVNFGYQGEFAEEDMDAQWSEFDLRTYDPQIGRFTSVDPYDQFASPYIGMGNNPVANIDPSGGVAGPFASAFLNHALWTVGGAIIGGVANGAANGFSKESVWQGVAYGAVGGLGASFVNWGDVGTSISNFGTKFFDFFSSNDEIWRGLSKRTLRNYIEDKYCPSCSDGRVEDMVGTIFERTWHQYVEANIDEDPDLRGLSNYSPDPGERFPGTGKNPEDVRNVQPDGIADSFGAGYQDLGKVPQGIVPKEVKYFYRNVWFEIKAKNGNIYESTSTYQIKGMITAMGIENPRYKRLGRNQFAVVTTYGVNLGAGVRLRAAKEKVTLHHYKAHYRMQGGKMQIYFSKSGGGPSSKITAMQL